MADAEAEFRAALKLKPVYAEAYLELGNALARQGKAGPAEAAYRDAGRYQPESVYAAYNLGRLLYLEGRFAEAGPLLRQAFELGQKQPGWAMAERMATEAERLAKLENTLAGVLGSDDRAAVVAELTEAIGLCQKKEMFAVAADLYGAAFAALPELPEEFEKGYRCEAARAALKAAAGLGTPVVSLDETARARLRRQALHWLRDDCEWQKRALALAPKDRESVAKRTGPWQEDPQFAPVRTKDALARLPAAEAPSGKSCGATSTRCCARPAAMQSNIGHIR